MRETLGACVHRTPSRTSSSAPAEAPRSTRTPRSPFGPRGFFMSQSSTTRRTLRKQPDDRADHRRAEPRPLARVRRRRRRLRHPRRRDPARLRPAVRLHGSGTSWSATSRAPATRPRATPLATGQVGVCMATSGPGATNLVTPDRRRVHGLGADRRHHRPGAQRGDRHGRLPGGRHPRHHDADHQAQLPRHRPGGHPADDRRGVPHRRAPAAPVRCSSTSPRTPCRR